RNAPFRFYKQNQYEGGISTPGIVHWPAGLQTEPGAINETPVHLIDVLPTLADISGSPVPDAHPDRELRPVSGVSLRPILEGAELDRAEPIHLQFSSDFGLRDGDWKLVSFKSQEWELYNMANDRTELENLAKAEPERLAQMIAKWKDMSLNVLKSTKLANPKIRPAVIPRKNREWTVFSDSEEPPAARSGKNSSVAIRARKNTKINRAVGLLNLTFTGEDPGIAMDLRSQKSLSTGPYMITFDLTTSFQGTGDLFYTIDPKTTLPNGERIPFKITGTEDSQPIRIALKTAARLHQLRIDLADGEGEAKIANLHLRNGDDKVLKDWTAK
ncbi:MAG: sulfatase/phosphatase domain-containing protein, partial [Verrucomicrobiota bacterium]